MEVWGLVIRNRKCTLARELVLNIARVKMWKNRICPFVCSLFYNAEDFPGLNHLHWLTA